jgi:hypothetical protein
VHNSKGNDYNISRKTERDEFTPIYTVLHAHNCIKKFTYLNFSGYFVSTINSVISLVIFTLYCPGVFFSRVCDPAPPFTDPPPRMSDPAPECTDPALSGPSLGSLTRLRRQTLTMTRRVSCFALRMRWNANRRRHGALG